CSCGHAAYDGASADAINPASPQTPPAAAVPQASPPATPQASSPPPADKKFVAPSATAELVGLNAKSSDDLNLGTVYGATMDPGGKVTSIGLRVGGFLGFGAPTWIYCPKDRSTA